MTYRKRTACICWGCYGKPKTAGFLPILALSRKCGYLVEIFYEKKRRIFADYRTASRRKVLIHLLNNQEKEFHLRELSRNVGEPAPVVKKELDRFDQMGFVLSWKAGNRRCFKVNRNFLLLPELKSLVDKSMGVSIPIKVAKTFVLRETVEKRKSWEMRSREIAREYGSKVKRQRPHHPTETRLLEKMS